MVKGFLAPADKNMEHKGLSFEEFREVSKSMKRSKDTGNDNIESKVINKVYDEISCPLFIVFNSSFREGIFPQQLKLQKVLWGLKLTTLKY